MKHMNLKVSGALAVAIAGILAMGPAMAEKPSWAGGGKADKNERMDKRDEGKDGRRDAGNRPDAGERSSREAGSRSSGGREHFDDRNRASVRDYYSAQHGAGHCPPGLAKKHNGCMPPGQAKKWHIGQPLAREVIYYDVPQTLVLQFGQPPSGYRYVRVASDILLMAIGTGMIIDAIQDLGRT